ncbi:hypothetical protein ON010_g2442 [Phytophthora cinnamomi]|nr:hypothetical protein ON010_g2442 [Phytophthora cinnamomi]
MAPSQSESDVILSMTRHAQAVRPTSVAPRDRHTAPRPYGPQTRHQTNYEREGDIGEDSAARFVGNSARSIVMRKGGFCPKRPVAQYDNNRATNDSRVVSEHARPTVYEPGGTCPTGHGKITDDWQN